MIRSLDDAVRAGEPLIDITVRFKDGVDCKRATDIANSLGPDLELKTFDWYGHPALRTGQMTAEGALRLFGVKIRRVRVPRWDPIQNTYDGVHDNFFRWDIVPIETWPDELVPYVKSISTPQPGADDDGQAYIPLFDRG